MTTVVCFRAGGAGYAVPVEHVREVRSCDALVPLPAPRPGVVGLLADLGDTLTVIDPLGNGNGHSRNGDRNGNGDGRRGEQVLLLEHDDRTFGLLVDVVTGVVTPTGETGPAPAGQLGHLVSGVVTAPQGVLLLLDVAALDESLRG